MNAGAPLGAKVRALRRRAQVTQVQLASQLGISPSYLNLIEQNRRPLTAPLLLKLAVRLIGSDMRQQTFFERNDENHRKFQPFGGM